MHLLRHQMDRLVIPLLVIAGGTLVLCNQGAVEILRSPSKVVIMKPDPLPDVKFANETKDTNGTSQTPANSANETTTEDSNHTDSHDLEQIIKEFENEPVINVLVTGTDEGTNIVEEQGGVIISNVTVGNNTDLPSDNISCIRRDYEDSAAAIFLDNAGPVDTAYIIFNSSSALSPDNYLNVTDVKELKVLNETTVDCDTYLHTNEGVATRKLSPWALSSLAG